MINKINYIMSDNEDNIIGIFGGGVAGSALAAHFEKFNIPYKLIDTEYTEGGYGITIQEADNILHYLNLKPNLDKINYLNRYIKINSNEEIIFSNCHSKGNYVIPRFELISLFKSKVNPNNIIKLDKNDPINIEELDDYVAFNEFKFSLLIGADGINSICRDKMNIKRDDAIIDTKFILEIKELKGSYSLIKNDVVEFISQVHGISRLRIFIKPNGQHGATCQIVYPATYNELDIKMLIPKNIYNDFGKTLYKTKLISTKYFHPKNNRIILLGDSLNGMIPYHGSGANTAIINANYLAHIIKDNIDTIDTIDTIANIYYDKIKDYTFRIVSESLNTFLQIHNPNFIINTYDSIYKYSPELLLLPKPASYRFNDDPIIFKNSFTEIILAGVNITIFPIEFTLIDNLEILNLNDNCITSLPTEIKFLTKLKELYLRNNKIGKLCQEINLLSNLEILRLSYNELFECEINLKKLRELCLTGNNINSIKLNTESIQKLYASDNNISHLDSLSNLKRIKYCRIGFNPIKLNMILKLFSTNQIKNLNELRISANQINIEGSLPTCIQIKYGNTLSKTERKYFQSKQFISKDIPIDMNNIKYEAYKNIADFILKQNTDTLSDIMQFIIKLNIAKIDIHSDINDNISLIKSKVTNIINSNQKNHQQILKIFTLFLTGNINSKFIDETIINKYIKTFMNESVIDFLNKNRRFINFKNGDIQKINKIYEYVKCLIELNPKESIIKKHIGLPIHPIEGRPRIGHLECLFDGCHKKINSGNALYSHLIKTVPNFCGYFHQEHENILSYLINIRYTPSFYNMKCPIGVCKFSGDMNEHLKQLGLKPFWTIKDVKVSNITNNSHESEFKIYESEQCMLCMDSTAIPVLLYDCGHRVLCLECGYELISQKINKECIVCRHKTKYILIA